MNKKIMLGVLALGTTAILGLTGCGDKKGDDTPDTIKYTVTFDHDNNLETQNQVVEFEAGTTVLNASLIPTAPEVDGFAGVWDSYRLEDKNIIVTAKYGDGSQQNPYLVSTGEQFKRILDDYTQCFETICLNEHSTQCEESEAVTKRVVYKTVSIVFTRPSVNDKWTISRYDANKVYFKLINDIDLAQISNLNNLDLSNRYFVGEIDGLINSSRLPTEENRYTLKNMDGTLLLSSSGAMFANIIDTTFKNLNIKLGSNLGSLVGVVRAGENYFNNITINNTDYRTTIMSQDDNNESAFVHHVVGEGTMLNFDNCVNNANMFSYADYSGIFVGGYATKNTNVNFNNCINNAHYTTKGKVGVFFGNDSHKPATYSITNCQHNGGVVSIQGSGVLAPSVAGTSAFSTDEKSYYSENIDGVLTGLNSNSFISPISVENIATITGTDIEILIDEARMGDFRLILSAYAHDRTGQTLFTNIVFKQSKTENGTTSIKFEDVYYGMMDLNTYNNAELSNKVDITSTTEWVLLEGYNIKYILDKTNGVYVIDYSAYGDSYTINVSASELGKLIVCSTGTNIDFIVDIENN